MGGVTLTRRRRGNSAPIVQSPGAAVRAGPQRRWAPPLRVRPAVAQDGGDIVFRHFDEDDGSVYLEMRGACAGCPSSTMTLKHGIETLLKHYVPEVTRVEQATA